MTEDDSLYRLPTKLWLDGYLRQHAQTGQSYYILRKGEPESGTIALKLVFLQGKGCIIMTQGRTLDGVAGWLPAFGGRVVSEEEATAYLDRLAERDPDVWIVEIETRDGSHPFPGELL